MSRSLRFCMITTFYPPYNFGGDGIFTYRLSNALAERGHHVDVVHCRDAYRFLAEDEPSSHYSDHSRVTVHGLESGAGALSPALTQQTGYPLLKGETIQKILQGRDADVINYHNISLVGGPKVLTYGSALKLYTMHEYWLICPTHVLFKNNEHACEEPTCVSCTLRHRRPPQLWRYTSLMEEALQHVDRFLAPSRFVANMHEERGLDLPTVHLPHFVPASEADGDAESSSPNAGRPYFLYVGRLEKLKGLQDVIPVFDEYSEADLLIAGTGTYQSTLERLAGENPRVKFLGHQSQDALQGLYANALALLVPSLCYETFGLTILEAFAHRTPAIARDIGALAELVEASGGGRLFETESELQEALRTFQSNPALRSKLGERGYATYQKQGTLDHYLDRYLSLIDNLG